jgi:hypothetical protein
MKEHRRPAIALVAMIGCVAARAQGNSAVHGSGTPNSIPVWTDSSTIGNSIVSQSGANIGGLVAASLSGSGFRVTNVNALTLGGPYPIAFAHLGLSNIFTVGQSIKGILTLGGAINNTLTLEGTRGRSL